MIWSKKRPFPSPETANRGNVNRNQETISFIYDVARIIRVKSKTYRPKRGCL